VYVCFCEAVTSREVEDAIDRGAESIREIGESTGAGTGCGGCHPTLEALLESRCAACPRLVAVPQGLVAVA
jgi:bacterioferritin-associated ferredoxin